MEGQGFTQVTFAVPDMGCGGCAAGIKGRLLETPGVQQAQVESAEGLAKIDYDPAVTDLQTLEAVISTAGYEVTQHPG